MIYMHAARRRLHYIVSPPDNFEIFSKNDRFVKSGHKSNSDDYLLPENPGYKW
ncbi:hypothetical protein ES705_19588 [subsurface metagenome]